MFQYYDRLYFDGSLAANAVVVEWSRRMTLCAGQCSYRGRGSVCRVALSEPLLKFRSATEVKETLLHEMIHAWQFVTAGRRDRTDHGPVFLAKMAEINAAAGRADMYRPPRGYSISVFHGFRDEVRGGLAGGRGRGRGGIRLPLLSVPLSLHTPPAHRCLGRLRPAALRSPPAVPSHMSASPIRRCGYARPPAAIAPRHA